MELEIIIDESRLNWPRRKIYAGVLEGECAALLRDFFGSLRG